MGQTQVFMVFNNFLNDETNSKRATDKENLGMKAFSLFEHVFHKGSLKSRNGKSVSIISGAIKRVLSSLNEAEYDAILLPDKGVTDARQCQRIAFIHGSATRAA